jgi:lipopolysaccharide transport system permease protein
LIIPLSSIGSGLVDFAIATIILLLLMVYYGVSWTLNLLMAPILVAGLVLTALGVGTFLSALNVAYRDFRYVVTFLVQFWLFATPVAYPASLVPAQWQWMLYLNPMAGVIEGFRSTFLGRSFDVPGLLVSLAIAGTLFACGILYFEKVERQFADII